MPILPVTHSQFKPLVAIILVNFKRAEETLRCIARLKKINYPAFKIYLVENGSSDQSAAFFRERFGNDAQIKLIFSLHNLGFAGGNNLALREILKEKYSYVLFLNNDTVVDADFLNLLINEAEKNKTSGLAGPTIFEYKNPQKVWFAGGKISWLRQRVLHKKKIKPHSRKNAFISGCCMLVKTKVFHSVGFLEEKYFLYYEDADFCLRAKEKGFTSLYVPNSKIWHDEVQATTPLKTYYLVRNGLYFFEKNSMGYKKLWFEIYSFLRNFYHQKKYQDNPSPSNRAVHLAIQDWKNKVKGACPHAL